MKGNARRAALIGVFAVFLLTAPKALAGNPTPAQALADLNAFRALAGVPAVTAMDPGYSDGCMKHNLYMQKTGDFAHEENPGSAYYTPEGADAGSNSVLAAPEQLPRPAWEGAVYHRTAVLGPRLRTSGYDASHGYTCMRVLTTDEETLAGAIARVETYPWPHDGMTDVPLRFEGGEFPDPCDAVPSGPCRLGYPLSIDLNGPWRYPRGARLEQASLTPDGGNPVAIAKRDSYNDDGFAWEPSVGIFPLAPLQPGTWYTARAAGVAVQFAEWQGDPEVEYPFSVSWRFRTAGDGPGPTPDPSPSEVSGPIVKAKKKQRQRGRRVKVKLTGGAQEAVDGVARGSIKRKRGRAAAAAAGSFKLKPARNSTAAGKQAVYKLQLKRKRDNRKVLRLLRRGIRLQAKASVTLTDASGNAVTTKKTIRLE